MVYIIVLIVIALIVILNLQFRFFYPFSKKIRILEYHSVSINGFEDQITISKEKFIQQLNYLKENNFVTLFLSDIEKIEKEGGKLPSKSVVLTFDDGFLDNYTEVYPLLQEYNFKAVCFMVLGRIGQNIDWPVKYVKPETMLINKNQIIEMSSHFEFGYHTYKHDSYAKMSFEEIENDLKLCQEIIKKEELNIYPALAYTFGRYFRKKDDKQKQFFALLEKYGIKYALRIGNRINLFPFKSKYEIQRIDIRGNEPMNVFKKRLWLGRKKIF
jgi:peptidoglycan/xylan/chitin deacetylase (PgdA/CDA1 family)